MSEQRVVDRVRVAFLAGAYRMTAHAEREREADSITKADRIEAFTSYDVYLLEDYPSDPRGHPGLFLGFTQDRRPVHAVFALWLPEEVVIITVYRPDGDAWYDWRRRISLS